MEIDWNKAPSNAIWRVVDENGWAHWFGSPGMEAFTDFWWSEPVQTQRNSGSPETGATAFWGT